MLRSRPRDRRNRSSISSSRAKSQTEAAHTATYQSSPSPSSRLSTARSESRLILGQIGTLDTLVVLSEDLAKFDGQFENAVNKIVDVLRSAFKGDESRLDFTCRIADRIQLIER